MTDGGSEASATDADEEQLYDDALDTWGLQAQVDQSIEELAKLIVALEGDDREAVIDELADVQVMVDQLAIAFDQDAVDERVAEKQARLRDRIDDARLATDGGQPVDSESAESSVNDGGTAGRPFDQELDELEEREQQLQEEKEELANGEVPRPWPGSSTNAFYIAGATLVTGGGLLAFSAIAPNRDGFFLAGLVSVLAAAAVANYGRWFMRHFETGQQPTYDTPDSIEALGVSGDD